MRVSALCKVREEAPKDRAAARPVRAQIRSRRMCGTRLARASLSATRPHVPCLRTPSHVRIASNALPPDASDSSVTGRSGQPNRNVRKRSHLPACPGTTSTCISRSYSSHVFENNTTTIPLQAQALDRLSKCALRFGTT